MSPKIMLVEDEFIVALDMRGQLNALGYEVVCAAPSVEDALSCVDTERIDAAVLDVNLQGRHVRPVAMALSERGVPFVFVTANAAELTGRNSFNAPVLPKPYIARELEEVLVRLIRKNK